MKTKVINLFAGPGTGKSTAAAHLFSLYKNDGVDCELVREYAKDVVWEGRNSLLENQLYVFAKQAKRMADLDGKVELIITDSPLLLSLVYSDDELLKPLVLREHGRYENANFFLTRVKKYNPNGRLQTEAEAKEIDRCILDMLSENDVEFTMVYSDLNTAPAIKMVLT